MSLFAQPAGEALISVYWFCDVYLCALCVNVCLRVCVCLSLSQAQQMLSACLEKVDVSNTEGYDLFLTQLKEGLKNTSHETAANHKVAKVRTAATAA